MAAEHGQTTLGEQEHPAWQLPVCSFGSCFLWAWLVLCAVQGDGAGFFPAGGAQEPAVPASALALALGAALGGAAVALLGKGRAPRRIRKRDAAALAAACLAGGVLVTAGKALLSGPCLVAGSFSSGAAGAFVAACWTEAYARFDLRDATTLVGSSLAGAFVLVAAVQGLGDAAVEASLGLFGPVSVAACVASGAAAGQRGGRAPGEEPAWFGEGHRIEGFPLLVCGMGFVGAGIVWTLSFATAQTGVADGTWLAATSALGCAAAVALTFAPFYRNASTGSFYVRVFLPLAGIALFAVALGAEAGLPSLSQAGTALLVFACSLLATLFALLLMRVSFLYDLPRTVAFALTCTATAAGAAAGMVADWAFVAALDGISVALAACGCLLVLVATTVVLSANPSAFVPARHADDGEAREEGRFARACDEAMAEGGLSAREREIFLLLAKGRNAEYVANTFVISRYTAKTHINNIYRKLGIHTREELLDLVERKKPPRNA